MYNLDCISDQFSETTILLSELFNYYVIFFCEKLWYFESKIDLFFTMILHHYYLTLSNIKVISHHKYSNIREGH